MNRFQIVLTACVFTAVAAWGQATNSSTPQAQPGSSAPSASQAQPAQPAQAGQTANTTSSAPQSGAPAATSAKNEISGCMTRGFANYQLADSATQAKYQIRGNGAELDQHANKVVQIQGVPDPKDSQGGRTIFYASTVKDSGQTCGTPDQMAANGAQAQPGASTAASSQSASNAAASNSSMSGANNSQQSASTATPNVQAGSPATAASTTASSNSTATQGTQVASAQPSADASSATPNIAQSAASTQQGGTAGVAASATQSQAATTEDKGTPQAGTPQTGSVGAPAGSSSTTDTASSQTASAGQTYQGCVSGDPNNLKFKTNGKDYRLQGDTRSVWKLIGHNVEVTGEDFGGKAIQINGAAKDLGSCKK